jgi:hypothetical protein
VTDVGPLALILGGDSAPTPITVPAAAMTALDVRLGRSLSLERGLLVGGAAGALGGMIILASCETPRFETPKKCLGGASAKAGAAMSLGLGALVGVVVSWMSDEVWAVGLLPR